MRCFLVLRGQPDCQESFPCSAVQDKACNNSRVVPSRAVTAVAYGAYSESETTWKRSRGVALEPRYKTVPSAALRDSVLYEFLAIVDALRDGRARERKIAERELIKRIRSKNAQP
jgi:hypothetical protein